MMEDLTITTTMQPHHLGRFETYIKSRISKNKNFMAAIVGPTGSGKTYSSLRLAENLDPSFTVERVVFDPREFMAVLNSNKLSKGSVVVFDEAGIALNNRQWQSQANKLINFVLQSFRHKCYIVIFTAPDFAFVDSASRKLFHSCIETVTIDQRAKLCRVKPLLLQVNQRNGDIYYKYLRVKSSKGLVPLKRIGLGLPSPSLIEAYELKKTNFTNEMNAKILKDLTPVEQPSSDGIDINDPGLTQKQADVMAGLHEGLTPIQVAERVQLNIRTVYSHMGALKRKGYTIRAIKEENRAKTYQITKKTNFLPRFDISRAGRGLVTELGHAGAAE
jgi:DNA-binding CsgD family transcriptional regulator